MQFSVALFVVVLCLGFQSSLCAYADAEYQSTFSSWMHTCSKAYPAEEFITKFRTFQSNMDFVASHNARTDTTHTVALNCFADLTSAEYAQYYLNKRIGKSAARSAPSADPVSEGHKRAARTATTVDWRTTAVTPIKDQGQCGSCWTFATVAGIESEYYLSTGTLVSLSEQNLLDCTSSSAADNGEEADCDGGDPQIALEYVIANGGIATEVAYPYTGTKAACTYAASEKGADITSYSSVTSGSESALETAVATQPIIVAIDAGQPSFQLYDSGIYSDSGCSSALASLDHAVVAVGYSVNSTSGAEYWIIKNSWGTSWGIQGYLYLARNSNNMCGVATYPLYPIRSSTTKAATTTTAKAATTTTGKAATTTTTAKAATTTTTAKAVTTAAAATTKSATTGGSTTGGSSTKYIYQDSMTPGWTITGSATNVVYNAVGVSNYAISASIPKGGSLTFTSSTAVTLTAVQFTFKSSVATTIDFELPGYNALALSFSTSWLIETVNIGGVSESSFSFVNAGTAAVTVYFDNVNYT